MVEKPVPQTPPPLSSAGDAVLPDLPRVIERLHRRFLDVLRAELTRQGVRDLAPVQMLLLLNMDAAEVAVQELIDRGSYLRAQTFYNIKKMVEHGYLEQTRSKTDRRIVQIRPTKKSQGLCETIRTRQRELAVEFLRGEDRPDALEQAHRVLRRLERTWDDYLRYGRP